MLKNLFGDLALDNTVRAVFRLLGRLSFSTAGSLRVIIAENAISQSVTGTVSITGQSGAVGYQQSQDNFNIGYRTRISKT